MTAPCWRALEVLIIVFFSSSILPLCRGNKESSQSSNSLIRGFRIHQRTTTPNRELQQEEQLLPKVLSDVFAYQFDLRGVAISSGPSIHPSGIPTDNPTPPLTDSSTSSPPTSLVRTDIPTLPSTDSPTPKPPTSLLPTSESPETPKLAVPYLSGELMRAIAQRSLEPSSSPAPNFSTEFTDEGVFLPEVTVEPSQTVAQDEDRESNTQNGGNEAEHGEGDQGGDTGQQFAVEGEADYFLPVQIESEGTAEAATKPPFYFVDLRPFSIFVQADRDISSDLGIPLYLLMEMGESLASLVNVKISNLTIKMGVTNQTMPDHRLLHVDDQHNHVHWNQLFFMGVAELEDSVVYLSKTVQNVQSLVLSDDAGLQEFWDNEGRGGAFDHIELVNITLLPFPNQTQQEAPKEETTPPQVVVSEEQATQAQTATAYPEPETERSSNVWVMVPLVLAFLILCFCIIGLCGRLNYLSSRAQERYNEKYGLDYNVYDKDISKDIFKEEYLMSEREPDPLHNGVMLSDSFRSIEFFTQPINSIESVRSSSNNVTIKPVTDDISTEEEEEDFYVHNKVGAVKKLAPENPQMSHDEPMVPPSQNGSWNVAPQSHAGSAREVFSDELEDDPPPLSREVMDQEPFDNPNAPAEVVQLERGDGGDDKLQLPEDNGSLFEPIVMEGDTDVRNNEFMVSLMRKSSSKSVGSMSSASTARRDSKKGLGNSSARERSFRNVNRNSVGSTGEDKSAVMGNSSGRDRSTRSSRSIRSVSSASSLGSFYSCQGDLV